MAAGLLIVALVLAVCTVILLVTVRADIKEQNNKTKKGKKVAEAEGAAEAQRLQQQTLTQELLTKQYLEKWDGKLPTYVGNGANFYMPVK